MKKLFAAFAMLVCATTMSVYATNDTPAGDGTKTNPYINGQWTMDKGKCQKVLRDGQLYILRDGKTYNAQGLIINN